MSKYLLLFHLVDNTGYLQLSAFRKKAMMLNNILVWIGSALMGLSKVAHSYEMLIVGRFIIGIHAGKRKRASCQMGYDGGWAEEKGCGGVAEGEEVEEQWPKKTGTDQLPKGRGRE